MGLFQREPETLDGFTPKFSRAFMRFNYHYEKVKVFRGFGVYDEADEDRYSDEHSIEVLGKKITSSREFYGWPVSDIIATMINEYIASKRGDEAYHFLVDNAHDLNISKKYWGAVEHLEKIEAVKREILEKQRQVERATYLASVNAVEVKAGRTLSKAERDLLLAEFTGEATNDWD